MPNRDISEAPSLLFDASGRFRILQVTDTHDDADPALVERTQTGIRTMVEQHKPDLICFTGDAWCSDAQPEQADTLMTQTLAFLGALGVPWAFAWGNHDAIVSEFNSAWARIAAVPNALAPAGNGRGSFRIELRGLDGKTPLFDLFVLNSGLEWSLPADLEWFVEESTQLENSRGEILPAMAFFHIPLEQYERKRLVGDFSGIGPEEIMNWGDEEGVALEMLKEPGNIRACFAGHNHRNDFYCEVDDILLSLGRVTGYAGYEGDEIRKGAKLITLDARANTFELKTVFPEGDDWQPDGPIAWKW